MQRKGFGTAINCIDGRVQIPVIEWMRDHFAVEWVDLITEPGADKVVAQGLAGRTDLLRQKVHLSVTRHDSRVAAIAGHHDCLANPVAEREHREYLKQAAARIAAWGLPVRVVSLWVNGRWEVEEVSDTGW